MLTLRHRSPFDLFDRLEQQLFTAERVPPAEIHESGHAYEVVLELPGVDRAAIDVKATDRTLVITAERRSAPAASAPSGEPAVQAGEAAAEVDRAGEPLMSEFRYGTWSRSFRFPAAIDRERLAAHYRDGLLTVTVPKAQTMTTVSVQVQA
ncbi:MAG: Hsp20/alpha crystallin family protein [Synechococcaceae cyanobacterium]|nr:Hsp20/alpha crystallin family protein [Synechococcaceae cyanobacterium]